MNRISSQAVMPLARNMLIAVAAGAVLIAGIATVHAQPVGGGPGMHGGGAPFEMMIPRMLEKSKAALNLNTSQQLQWDAVVAQGKTARESGRANRQQVKTALTTELAKAEPDLAAVAAAGDAAADQARAQRIAIRNEWLALYATFSADQKAVVKDGIQKHMARAESFREKMREHFQQRSNGKAAT